MFPNIPQVRAGIVAVSRDCFPIELSQRRRAAVMAACKASGTQIIEIQATVENETDALAALRELADAGCNALIVYLGNFGPEGPETMMVQKFAGPAMLVAAAEESAQDMMDGRGDAYCGMLNASYSLGLRGLRAYIPEFPVGTAQEVASMIGDFLPVARVVLGVKQLKILSFGPRPHDFIACNAPIKQLFDMGVEVQENSELDLFASFKEHEGDKRIENVVADMAKELGHGNGMPGILPRLAQLELTLTDWMQNNLGASQSAVFANKCWPAFQTQFGMVPCYVNSRLTGRMIPVACEVDLYGAVSEFMIACATLMPPTLLDINNTVPEDIYAQHIQGKYDYKQSDTFMGFHCGNTPACYLQEGQMKYQRIMKRSLEPDTEPDITRGTLEGDIRPSQITLFRIQGAADGRLTSYVAQGEVLPVATHSFGGIGIFAVKEMARFYRHVLIDDRYPHHAGVAFAHAGKALFSAAQMLGADKVSFNHPQGMLYKSENPFS